MNNKAFTLIEMLVVVGIQAVQTGSRESQRENDIRNFQGLVEDYYSKFKQYPSTTLGDRQIKADFALQANSSGSGTDDITYICLLNTGLTNGAYGGVNCDSSAVAGGNIYRVYKFGIPVRLVFNMAFTSSYASTAGAHCADPIRNPPSYTSWYLYYSVDATSSSRPQAYRLGRCSEYGLANPSGSKLD